MEVAYMPDGVPGKKKSKAIEWLAKAGLDNIVLDLRKYCTSYELEHREKVMETMDEYPDGIFASVYPERLLQYAEKLSAQCHELQMKNTIGIAPALSWDTERDDIDELVYEITRKSILACKKAGCRYIIINPLAKKMETEEEWERNIGFYQSFGDSLTEGLNILIPNHYRAYNGHFIRGTFSDPYRLSEFVDELNSKSEKNKYGLCIDVGVCNILGQNMNEFLCLLQDRVKAVVIRENDAVTDNALLPFSVSVHRKSRMDWTGIIRGLRKADFDGQLIFDFHDSSEAHSHLLRADFDLFIKKFVDYFAWQISMEKRIKKYGKRVMFGAGNMFRNYMKYYGTEYPPLFTCDNNSSIWGTKAEGVEIRNPEELRNIPEDCAIFICNVYYREIEKQLRKMGIANRIEYYNDEYLPYDAQADEV